MSAASALTLAPPSSVSVVSILRIRDKRYHPETGNVRGANRDSTVGRACKNLASNVDEASGVNCQSEFPRRANFGVTTSGGLPHVQGSRFVTSFTVTEGGVELIRWAKIRKKKRLALTRQAPKNDFNLEK